MALATYSDVATVLGRPIDSVAEQAQVAWWLDGIELFIRVRLGDVSLLDQAALRYVEAEAVAEKVRRRGTNESSVTVSIDDGSVTRRFDNPASVEDITDEWWNLLDPTAGTQSASIRPGFDADASRWPVQIPGWWNHCGNGEMWR